MVAGTELTQTTPLSLLVPFGQVQAVLPHTHLTRAEEMPTIPSSACGLASPRNPATIPNVSERLFWMKKVVQFYLLCRSLYFW